MDFRIEKDFLGEVEIPSDALYGIHSFRARHNFPDRSRFSQTWYKATGITKQACYMTFRSLKAAAAKEYAGSEYYRSMMTDKLLDALEKAAGEVAAGDHFDAFIVPAISGGAGTSINMNVNEIIANRSLQLLGKKPGEYRFADPVEHANIFQSTNDVVPTALKLAAILDLQQLESAINALRFAMEEKEKQFRDVMRVAYTQMQSAVPSSYGILFSNYSDALSRDWWRVSKCVERIKVVNLGGGAVGTGMAIPRYFIMEVVRNLRKITGLPLTRSENIGDTTSNLDALAEVHAVIKALAVNLEKMTSDLRLLASDVAKGEVILPDRQVGSSIMPGKVNPVIAEYVISMAHRVYANDMVITLLAGQGCLDLNPYIPVIGDALLQSLELLTGACNTLRINLIEGIRIDREHATEKLFRNAAITTALVPLIGYHKASQLAFIMKEKGLDVFEANRELVFVEEAVIRKVLSPNELLKLGFSLKEIGSYGKRERA